VSVSRKVEHAEGGQFVVSSTASLVSGAASD
jgi:hypothetical protein